MAALHFTADPSYAGLPLEFKMVNAHGTVRISLIMTGDGDRFVQCDGGLPHGKWLYTDCNTLRMEYNWQTTGVKKLAVYRRVTGTECWSMIIQKASDMAFHSTLSEYHGPRPHSHNEIRALPSRPGEGLSRIPPPPLTHEPYYFVEPSGRGY